MFTKLNTKYLGLAANRCFTKGLLIKVFIVEVKVYFDGAQILLLRLQVRYALVGDIVTRRPILLMEVVAR